MPRLALQLLGPPRIAIDTNPVSLPRRKALALLIYLAATRRSHGRDALATLLWPGYAQAEARSYLRRALNSLRRAVGPRWIETDRNAVALSGDADVSTDVDHFHALIADCRTHGHPQDGVCPLCLPLLDEATADQPAEPANLPPLHNLPAPTTPFVGRKHEQRALAQLLDDETQRLITILGPGGIGKSRLALEAAAQFAVAKTQAIYLVQPAPATEAADIVSNIAGAAGVHLAGGKRPPKEQLLSRLRHQHILLLLDSFEHLLDHVHLLQDLFASCPQLRLLVTSLARMYLVCEAVFTLAGMEYPTWELAADLAGYDAMDLFIRTAQRIRPCAPLPPDDMQYVAPAAPS